MKIYWPAPKGNPKLFHTLMGSYSTKTSPSFYKWGLCVCNSQSHTWQHHLHTNLMLKLNFGYLEFVSVWYFHFYICYIMNSKIEYIGMYLFSTIMTNIKWNMIILHKLLCFITFVITIQNKNKNWFLKLILNNIDHKSKKASN